MSSAVRVRDLVMVLFKRIYFATAVAAAVFLVVTLF